jgi:Mg2+ and Co2+ transporter CorA
MSDIYDVDDFSEVINDVIEDILKSSHPLNDILHDYNEYVNDVIKQFMALDFIKDDDKVELQTIQRKIEKLLEHTNSSNNISF